ncbi:hypothetical protein Ddc_09873 [Ditylenchus destructor]|nr:hypothetical protein Ddc_09873 [Ditylenchus destructor]
MIHYSMIVEKQQLVDIVQQKSTYPESRIVIRLNTFEEDGDLQDAFNTICNEFLASVDLQVLISLYRTGESLKFRFENSKTKEVLRLSCLTANESDEKFNLEKCCIRLFLLERFIV